MDAQTAAGDGIQINGEADAGILDIQAEQAAITAGIGAFADGQHGFVGQAAQQPLA